MKNLLEVSIIQTKTVNKSTKPQKRGFVLLIESLHEGNTFIKYDSLDQLKYELYHDGIQKILADHKLHQFLALLNDNMGQYVLNGIETCVRTEIVDDPDFNFAINLIAKHIRRKYHFNMNIDIMGVVIANNISDVFIQCLKEERILSKDEMNNLVDELYTKYFTKEARKMFTNKKTYANEILITEGKGDIDMTNLPLQGKLVTEIPGTIRSERNGKVFVHKETDPNGIPLAVEYPNGQVFMPNPMHYSGGRQTPPPVQLTSDEIDLMDVSNMYPTQIKDILKNK